MKQNKLQPNCQLNLLAISYILYIQKTDLWIAYCDNYLGRMFTTMTQSANNLYNVEIYLLHVRFT